MGLLSSVVMVLFVALLTGTFLMILKDHSSIPVHWIEDESPLSSLLLSISSTMSSSPTSHPIITKSFSDLGLSMLDGESYRSSSMLYEEMMLTLDEAVEGSVEMRRGDRVTLHADDQVSERWRE